ncbi:hypothetical protein [Paenibacillus sp. FSL L8-0709]|uniref:hypothetical protein n=1 Tax=Paenibacillus sp. FSL L8-0709 TaxID=2975312 RepID=UPI0030FC22C3
MGDFAELNVRFKLKIDTPEEIINLLEYMAMLRAKDPIEIPDHPLFEAQRWNFMLGTHSDPTGAPVKFSIFEKDRSDGSLFICVRSVYKDRGEAALFFDWIYPFIDALWLEFLGYIKYDSNEHPQLIYYTDDGMRFIAIKRDETENITKREITFDWGITDVTSKT